jgi:hypothetical protein
MYILGAVLGQLPFMFLFTRIPMFYLIPFLDVAWGIFTLLQYRVHSFAELAAYRFLVGWFEAAFVSPNLASHISQILTSRKVPKHPLHLR